MAENRRAAKAQPGRRDRKIGRYTRCDVLNLSPCSRGVNSRTKVGVMNPRGCLLLVPTTNAVFSVRACAQPIGATSRTYAKPSRSAVARTFALVRGGTLKVSASRYEVTFPDGGLDS